MTDPRTPPPSAGPPRAPDPTPLPDPPPPAAAPATAGPASAAPGESLATLLHGYRVHARAPRGVVAALTERPRTLRALVQDSGLPRRSVEEILGCLGDDLRPGSGATFVLRPGAVDRYRTMIDYDELRAGTTLDPLAAEIGRHSALVTTMHELIASAPRPRTELDHVPATAATVVRRAVWLSTHYDLREAHLLCVGDHDLTSLAVVLLAAAASPGPARRGPAVTVVDIDEDLLEFLDRTARSRDLRLRCLYADLRFGLPPAVAGSADLAFTDPPYTPRGVSLFAARGAQGLADRERGRVLVAYGFSERVPTLGWKVQRALLDQGLVFEAIWPAFHTYEGAEAVGARADMYVCQPTSATWKHLDRPVAARGSVSTAIYTRGRQATESQPAPLAGPVVAAATGFLAIAPGRGVFVGDRPELDAAHAHLGTVLEGGLPAAVAAGASGALSAVADLSDDPGPWLTRLLLAVNADRLAVIVAADHPVLGAGDGTHQALDPLRAKWAATPEHDVAIPDGGDTGRGGNAGRLVTFAAVDPAVHDPGARLARWLLDRPHGKIGNVWRDGLIRIARQADGRTLSQREALATAHRAVADPDLLAVRLIDLPWHTLASTLAAAVACVDTQTGGEAGSSG
ncbi:bis-aminopropyl spermidine synthase family protein [Frankia gtarii]|uniref:bis-aminopropyl spermidine synthase family protein n=1 Tax=Frankia gtarii TaxID=2950102 RepID=UPI0021BFAAD1|nr:bis-aminopropyl spermidine synthase family protein [Frankia gtarii]